MDRRADRENVLDTKLLTEVGVEEAQAGIPALHADSITLFDAVNLKDLTPYVPACP